MPKKVVWGQNQIVKIVIYTMNDVNMHIHDIGMIEIELYRASCGAEPTNKVGRPFREMQRCNINI